MKNVITEKKLLELLNKYLKANSEARRLQTEFDIAGVSSATLIDLKEIIAQSTKHE